MNFLEPITLAAVAQIVWPLCRISAFLATMLVISGNSFPMMTRALLSLAVTVCFLPSIPNLPADAAPFSAPGILTTIKEVLIGLCMGLATLLISQAFIVAGQTIAMQTGLGFAS
ncbi:MAG: flagellar biosynthetic protein FliR, partial [Succinivibrio sp.]|nr:flagellar biosynthetic protein FliR [Succinivibrio sp.]